MRDSDNGTLYAGVEDPVNAPSGSGVFQSIDGGTNWTAMDTGLTNKKVQALAVDGASLYAGTREETVTVGSTTTTFTGGVFKWNGSTWTNISSGTGPPVCRLSPPGECKRWRSTLQSPAVIYAGTQGDGVYKTIDGGTTWSAAPEPGFPVRLPREFHQWGRRER